MKILSFSRTVVLSLSTLLVIGAADSCPPKEEAKPASVETQAGTEKPPRNPRARKANAGKKAGTDEQNELRRFWRDPELVQKLKLKPDQVKSLDVFMEKYIENLRNARQGVGKGYQKLMIALSQKVVNEKGVEDLEREFREAGAKRLRVMTGRLVAFRAILDHDQWIELRRLRPRAFQIDRFRPTVAAGSSARAFISGPEKTEGDPVGLGELSN